jgi:hypothetical protein
MKAGEELWNDLALVRAARANRRRADVDAMIAEVESIYIIN